MIYSYLAVDRIPKELSDGIVYHNQEFELGAMLCACGCGHRIDLLVPDSHQLTSVDGLATIRPSILVSDAPCNSHYYISDGRVEWLTTFTPAQVASIMRNQIARHASRDLRQPSWIERWLQALLRTFNKLRSFFRR
jgi:hypothetical protein